MVGSRLASMVFPERGDDHNDIGPLQQPLPGNAFTCSWPLTLEVDRIVHLGFKDLIEIDLDRVNVKATI